MRVRKNPDKWIRKAVGDRIDNMVIDGVTVGCIDTNYTGDTQPKFYVAMSTQTKRDNQTSKCGWEWDCSILLDITTRYLSTGNTGSRTLANDIEERIILLMNDFAIEGGFRIDEITVEESISQDGHTNTEVYFRQLLRYRIQLTEIIS